MQPPNTTQLLLEAPEAPVPANTPTPPIISTLFLNCAAKSEAVRAREGWRTTRDGISRK